jgi:putative DNA primase/helicase
VNRGRPCAVCGGNHKCSYGEDGLILCGRKSGDVPGFVYLKQAKGDPQFAQYRREDDPALNRNQHPHGYRGPKAAAHKNGAAPKPRTDWGAKAQEYAGQLSPQARARLARDLGLPESALAELPIGCCKQEKCWTFPERDASVRVIGINRRFLDGRKKAMPGSQRGLTIPRGWRDRDGPVFCPEGPSDVLALTAMNLAAVGRPSNTGGVEHLAELLRDVPESRPIIVLGEMDAKPNGDWPGRDGAEATAKRLAKVLGRPVCWAISPDGSKDARQWFRDRTADLTCTDQLQELGEHFVASLKPREVKAAEKPAATPPVILAAAAAPGDGARPCIPPGLFGFTDLGNAQRLAHRHGGDVRYCHPWNKWLVWDGRRWAPDDTGAVVRRATDTIRAMYAEAQATEDSKLRQRTADHAVRPESAKSIRAMVDLARSRPGIHILPQDLDSDPWLLNVLNGTIDLKTGRLREHRRGDYITKLCPTPFDEHAACPVWLDTLSKIFGGNERLVGYMRRLLGYCLTGSTSEQILAILWGAGRNGKSTVITAIMELLSEDYAIKAGRDLFMARKQDAHPTGVARLHGRRLAVCIETQDGGRLDEGLVKELTGGDLITARRMREGPWQFTPTHKCLLITNHKPEIRGTDEGIWRRQRLVPFTVRFWDPDKKESGPPELEVDKTVSDRLRQEHAGILAWCVQGCLGWQRGGMQTPPEVLAATEGYRNEQDVLGAFLAECCLVGPDYRCRAGKLYGQFREWHERSGESNPMSQRRFGEAMTEREFERDTSDGVWYRGVTTR